MIIEKEGEPLSLEEFQTSTGAVWVSSLLFEGADIFENLSKQYVNLHRAGKIPIEQIWLGKYFEKEIQTSSLPDVVIRWIDPILGWGVFANRAFKKMEFIAEYAGKIRKRKKTDVKNAYCFEYLVAPSVHSPYTIDALDQGNLSRYINHSSSPNLISGLATVENISHVILYTKQSIAKGAQICYDYGPDYWAKRTSPISL